MIKEEAPQPNNQLENNVVFSITGEKLSEEISRKDSFKLRSSSDYDSEESLNKIPDVYQRSDTKSLKRKPKSLLSLKGKKNCITRTKASRSRNTNKRKEV